MADSDAPAPIRLDGGQVEAILAARRNAIDLGEELRKFKDPQGTQGFLAAFDRRIGGIVDQVQRGERLALKALSFADKLAQRHEAFIRFLGLEGGDAASVRALSDTVTGALRGGRALGAIVPVFGVGVGIAAGAAAGSFREGLRQQHLADAIDERNAAFLADEALKKRQEDAIRERRRRDASTERARARVGG